MRLVNASVGRAEDRLRPGDEPGATDRRDTTDASSPSSQGKD